MAVMFYHISRCCLILTLVAGTAPLPDAATANAAEQVLREQFGLPVGDTRGPAPARRSEATGEDSVQS